jgi:hypothetical protein
LSPPLEPAQSATDRRAHDFAEREPITFALRSARPGRTAVRTAVPGGSMVRMGSAVRFRRGAPHKPAGQAGSNTRPVVCDPLASTPFARDLPEDHAACPQSTRGVARLASFLVKPARTASGPTTSGRMGVVVHHPADRSGCSRAARGGSRLAGGAVPPLVGQRPDRRGRGAVPQLSVRRRTHRPGPETGF